MKKITDIILIRYIEENLHEDNMKEIKKLLIKDFKLKQEVKTIRKTLKALKEFGALLELNKIKPVKKQIAVKTSYIPLF